MKWKHPPLIKIYEALGSVADKRVEVSDNSAKIFSSSGNKFYTVTYDASSQSIMMNDNGSFYKGIYFYTDLAKNRYLSWTKGNLTLWENVRVIRYMKHV